MYFGIQSVFISTYAIISNPQFSLSGLQSSQSDTHSFNSTRSIMTHELCIDTLMASVSQHRTFTPGLLTKVCWDTFMDGLLNRTVGQWLRTPDSPHLWACVQQT